MADHDSSRPVEPRRASRWDGPADALLQSPPPPPPPLSSNASAPEVATSPPDGRYIVRGVVYLQGELHADKLVQGAAVEVLAPSVRDGPELEWTPAQIDTSRDVGVPNTALTLRFYSVTMSRGSELTHLEDVPAASIRIRVGAVGDIYEKSAVAPDPTPLIDEHTGLGAWQIVTAPAASADDGEADVGVGSRGGRKRERSGVVDVSKELDRARVAAVAADAERRAGGADEDADNAYSSANPFGGRYRGVDMSAHAETHAGPHGASTDYAGKDVTQDNTSGSSVMPAAFLRRALKPGQRLRRREADD